MELKDGVKTFYAADTEGWRTWLEKNHATEKNVWLIIYKKGSGIPSITYDLAVDEALCWGWIDSKINKRDADSFYQFFAKRNPKSNWSRVNKLKIAKLEAENRLQKAGFDMITLAKETGTWTALDDVENGILPPDLAAALAENSTAQQYFEAFPRSAKRGILEWLLNAKTPETRLKRINEIVKLAAENLRANQYQPKETKKEK